MKDVSNVKDMERIYKITWDQLAELEPELDKLLTEARSVGECCRTWRDVEKNWTPFKNPVHKLVGLFGKHRGHPILGTVAAYDVTYWKLHNAVARDRRGN
jgi:hypothetical protein